MYEPACGHKAYVRADLLLSDTVAKVPKNASPRNDGTKNYYALNQPCASPVKEKYSPAAVSAHETISMALSN
jgi:hypothetical protein